jgi:ABC-type nitrate/sulfonate/bicarbonate transport system substrate-binding protein
LIASRQRGAWRREWSVRHAVLLGLIVPLLIVGCGSSSSSTSSASSGTASSAAATTAGKSFSTAINVSFPFLPIVQFYPLELGKDYGIFKRYGLDVNVKIVPDGTIAAALNSGAVQFHITSPPLELAYAAGVPIKLIGVYGNHTQTYLAAAPGIKSVKDLVGKKIGITAATGYSAIIAKYALHQAGVPFSAVKFVPIGTTNPSQAIVSGLADAVDSDPTQLALAEKGKPGVSSIDNFTSVLWPSGQIWGYVPWMNAHKQETAVFLKAFNAAVVQWEDNPTEAKHEIAKYNDLTDPTLINTLYNATKAEFNTGSTPVQAPSTATESFIMSVLRLAGFSQATDTIAQEGHVWTPEFWNLAFG